MAPAGVWTLPARSEAPDPWAAVVLGLGTLAFAGFLVYTAARVELARATAGQPGGRRRRPR